MTGERESAGTVLGAGRAAAIARGVPRGALADLAINGDNKTIAAAVPSGLLTLDATTGERRAWACGWHFGLHGGPPRPAPSAVPCRPD